MFEKEAEDSFKCKKVLYKWETDKYSYIDGFKDGAEFGYNKANEWRNPSEKLPEECSLVLAYLFEETEPTICKYVVSNQWECLPKRIVFCSNDQVRKWKEITPSKEVKENEN